jgi:membrane fusion protein (multidrug efflux system)
MNEEVHQKKNRHRRKRAYIALALVFAALIIVVWFWYRQHSKYYATDDAFIDADRVSVSSKILGRIADIFADEGDTVTRGELLVVLDSNDLTAQRIQAEAARHQAVASLSQAVARLQLDQKNTLVQKINSEKAKEDLDRATAQLSGNVISQETYDHIHKAYEAARAIYEASQAEAAVGKTQVESARLSIKTADAQIGTIQAMLDNTRICAPCPGRIAKKWLYTGDIAQPGQSILTITKDSLLWVTALFEETKIAGIGYDKQAEFTVDAYPGVHFYGEVFDIGTNTAAQFSLIPPNNASGNFTKVTQRIPVKISILRWDHKDLYPDMHLISGMSVYVKIYK